MTDYADVVEELRGMDAGDRVWMEINGDEGEWMMAKQPPEFARAKKDRGGEWVGGRLSVELRPPEWVVNDRDLVMADATLRMESEEDEWVSDPSIRLAEEESGDGFTLWDGEERSVEEIGVVVRKDVWQMRERAASAAEDLMERQSSVARVVLADCVVDYVASESKSDVWGDYRQDAGEESVSGFLEWVSARQFCRVLADQGVELFPEFTGRVDVSQRTAKDTLDALRYFRNLED